MGRKGDSKRKPSQNKLKPAANDSGSGSVSSAMKDTKTTPTKPTAADRKKKP